MLVKNLRIQAFKHFLMNNQFKKTKVKTKFDYNQYNSGEEEGKTEGLQYVEYQ